MRSLIPSNLAIRRTFTAMATNQASQNHHISTSRSGSPNLTRKCHAMLLWDASNLIYKSQHFMPEHRSHHMTSPLTHSTSSRNVHCVELNVPPKYCSLTRLTLTASTTPADQFTSGKLDRADLSPSPFSQFHAWYSAASDIPKREACTLSTAALPSGRVSARVVYLKELDGAGFVLYSNWGTSRKASDVASNPFAALTFWWNELERQVRVEGPVERLTSEESQRYFDVRVRGSRVGAWASRQSRVLSDREELEQQVREVEERFEGQDGIPVPEFWGGLRVVPEVVEFWQGRESRLHDRFRYSRDSIKSAEWKIERLSP